MDLPSEVEQVIDKEVSQLSQNQSYDVSPSTRLDLFKLIGTSAVVTKNDYDANVPPNRLPLLTVADRIRARIAIVTAQKVSALWDAACRETDWEKEQDAVAVRQKYLQLTQRGNIVEISAFDVPRPYIPQHILAMAELALKRNVKNEQAFLYEVNEWWGIFPTPQFSPRAFSIKWAAQEALYLSVLWQSYNESDYDDSISSADLNNYAVRQTEAPAGHAVLAYAGVFDRQDVIVDLEKRREFWLWWFTWAIPFSFALENSS